jgi:hypothetical protein
MQRFRYEQQNSDGTGGGGGSPAPSHAAPAPSPAPSPSPTPAPSAAWYGSDANKAVVEAKQFKGVDDVFTWATNAEKLIGAERAGRTVVLPKDDKDAEGIKAFRAKLGVPESADKYELPVPEGQDGGFAKLASNWFHEAGVPKSAAQVIAKQWNDHIANYLKEAEATEQAESGKQLDSLKGEWGDKFDTNSEHARRFMKASGWDDAKIARYEATFGTADMLKTFQALGAKMGEAGFVSGDGQGSGGVSPQQAKEKLNEARLQRIDGKLTDKQWQEAFDKYGALAEKAA